MANNERLTKRVKKMEDWIAENGSGPTLDNFNWLIDVFQEVSSMGKINCLTEFFSYHKKFLHRLMLGYQLFNIAC